MALGVLSACGLPMEAPRTASEQKAIDLTELREPGDLTTEELFHVVNYLPTGDYRRAFWFCHAALNPDYPYAETIAIRLGACHRFNAWDCGGRRVTPDNRVRAYTWYSYAALFNPAVKEKLIDPLQAHMTAEELAMARLTTGAQLKAEDRLRSLYGFLNCAQYKLVPE